MLVECYVCSYPRNPLIYIFKRLQIRELHHHEKSLFKWILYSTCFFQHQHKHFFQQLWLIQWLINRFAYPDRNNAKPSR